MKKKAILYILLEMVFLAVFNTVFFVASGFSHPASVWLSYGFIHFAYFMVILTAVLIRKSSSSDVFGFSLYSISATYFFVEFIVGLVFMFLGSDHFKGALIFQIVLAGIYAVMLLAILIANEHTADSEEKHGVEVAFIKSVSSRVKILCGKATDKKANKEIEKVYDILHSSPSRSNPSVKENEEEIKDYVEQLEDAVMGDKTDKIMSVAKDLIAKVEERNRQLKTSN